MPFVATDGKVPKVFAKGDIPISSRRIGDLGSYP
jgi:hypothetical protein